MALDDPTLNVALALDAEGIRREIASVESLARGMGSALTTAFRSAVTEGGSLGEVLRALGTRLSDLALSAALKPVDGFFGAAFQRVLGGLPTATPFAKGGVVASPSYFPLGAGLGLAGERGPEAILPLARGTDGRLGVRASSTAPVQVTVHVATPDVDGFRRAEGQVTAALARAVSRGRRGL